tara:strand:+ start:87 stop:368 length:282 start_codon:yes stop_codon:yes gene_type:complete
VFGAARRGTQVGEVQNKVYGMMVMRLEAALTASGIIGFFLLEALKILMVPIAAWVMGLFAVALKVFLISLGVVGVLGIGFFVCRRSQKASAEV